MVVGHSECDLEGSILVPSSSFFSLLSGYLVLSTFFSTMPSPYCFCLATRQSWIETVNFSHLKLLSVGYFCPSDKSKTVWEEEIQLNVNVCLSEQVY